MIEILGIIPARGGSKGVPRKNVRLVAGQPLITYSIEAALHSQRLTRRLVSTEDAEIADTARRSNCPVLARPIELAGDATPMKAVVADVLTTLRETLQYAPDILVLLQPTTPLRTAIHIDDALSLLLESNADAVVSVTEVPRHYNPDWQLTVDNDGVLHLFNGNNLDQIVTRRQELTPTFIRNGAIYAIWTHSFIQSGSLYGNHCSGYLMAAEDSVNIDTEDDLALADKILTIRGLK